MAEYFARVADCLEQDGAYDDADDGLEPELQESALRKRLEQSAWLPPLRTRESIGSEGVFQSGKSGLDKSQNSLNIETTLLRRLVFRTRSKEILYR